MPTLVRVCVAEPVMTSLPTLTGTCVVPEVPLKWPPTKLKVPIFPEPEIPKFPLFKVRVVKVAFETRTLPADKV